MNLLAPPYKFCGNNVAGSPAKKKREISHQKSNNELLSTFANLMHAYAIFFPQANKVQDLKLCHVYLSHLQRRN